MKTALAALSRELDEPMPRICGGFRRFRRLAATEYADADAAREGVRFASRFRIRS
ncbi:MAG: hypothetical protein ACLR5G_17150 [Eubacteriales bacterium]